MSFHGSLAHSFLALASIPLSECIMLCCCAWSWLCPTLCGTMDCSPPGSSVHRDSPGKNTRVGYHALLQGIFPAQGSNPGLPHCRQILYCLGHQGSPGIRDIWRYLGYFGEIFRDLLILKCATKQQSQNPKVEL